MIIFGLACVDENILAKLLCYIFIGSFSNGNVAATSFWKEKNKFDYQRNVKFNVIYVYTSIFKILINCPCEFSSIYWKVRCQLKMCEQNVQQNGCIVFS